MLTTVLKLGRIFWQLFATVLIVSAILIAGARLLLLDINSHNEWFEQWLARTLDRPVSIGELSGEWRGWSPSLRLDALTVYEANKIDALVHFKYAHVDISIADSIRHLDLKPKNITLGGVEFTLEQDADGNYAIAGMPPARWPVARWVEEQRRLTLTEAKIRIVDFDQGKPPQIFRDLNLSIIGDGQNRQISGSAKRHTARRERWEFRIDANASILSSDWDGEIYLKGNNVDVLTLASNSGLDLDHTELRSANFQINSKWQKAKLRKATYEANLGSDVVEQETLLGIRGAVERLRTGWSVGLIPTQFAAQEFSENAAPMLRVRFLDAKNNVVWHVSNLQIEHLASFSDALLPTDSLARIELSSLNPEGLIRDALIVTTDNAPFVPLSGRIALDDFSTAGSNHIPAVSALDFSVNFIPGAGEIHIEQPQSVTIESEHWLEDAISLNQLDGLITWHRDDTDDIVFSTEDLQAEVESFATRTTGFVKVTGTVPGKPRDKDTYVDLVTYVEAGDLAKVAKLVPKNIMPKKGEHWARNALKAGEIDNGAIAFRGNLRNFPFDDKSGVFRATFDARDVDIKYGAKWPMVENVAGQLNIENRAVKFTVSAGDIYSSKLEPSVVEIPDLFTKQRTVQITGKTVVNAEDVNKFINESPLKNTNAKRFKNADIGGKFGLELDINLGIFPGGEKELLGQAHFDGNRIQSRNLKLALEELNGSVSFTRQDWYGEGMSATFEGNRVGVLLNGGLDDPNYDTEIRLTGTSNAEFIMHQMKTYAPGIAKAFTHAGERPSITGATSWKTVISLPSSDQGNETTPRKINLQSSLTGLDIDMPWPLGKTREQSIPFSMTVHSSAKTPRVNHIILGDRVSAKIEESALIEGGRTVTGADLLFAGSTATHGPINGVTLHGQLAHFDPSEWQAILQRFAERNRPSTTPLPINIDLGIQNLVLLGNEFPNTHLSGLHNDQGWRLKLNGDHINGEIGAPDDPKLPVHLKFSRLTMAKRFGTGNAESLDPRKLRPISLESLATKYGDINLGSVSVSTERIADGMRLSHASAEVSTFRLNGSGEWTVKDGINQSQLNGSIKGDSLAGLLGSFGYEIANIEGGATELQLNAFWPGTPAHFALENLRGHLTLDVEAGRFLDIEPGGGRLFGLLSLQTLPRRLSLDFNDLFSKGFTFDNIDGTFSIDHGNAYTNSLLMDGPSARIQISGRTGLKEKDYDQRVTVTPALSNSIPVASALFGPAGIGVGAVIYLGQKMFKSIPEQMDKFLSREYSITGEWSSPIIEKI